MRGPDRRPALLGPAALLALAAVWLCAPAAVRASCGDYVLVSRAPATHPPAPTIPTRPAADPRPHTPCHGPMCSRGSLPLLPPVTVAPPAPHQPGDLPALLPPPALDRFAWLTAPDLRRLPGCHTTVYHPPRAPAAAPFPV